MKKKIFNQYVRQVCKAFNISRKELFSKTKKIDAADARHLLYYLCSKRKIKLAYIQQYMGDNDYEIGHSSINYGITKFTEMLESDEDWKEYVNDIISDVKS